MSLNDVDRSEAAHVERLIKEHGVRRAGIQRNRRGERGERGERGTDRVLNGPRPEPSEHPDPSFQGILLLDETSRLINEDCMISQILS